MAQPRPPARGSKPPSALLCASLVPFAALVGCGAVGEVDGLLAGHRFGAIRAAWHGSYEAEGLTVTSVVLSDFPYTCDELAYPLGARGDSLTSDDGKEVGLVILHLVGELAAGQTEVLDAEVEGEGAVVVVEVLQGEGYGQTAWVLADEGTITLDGVRRRLDGSFEIQSSGGAFSGTFSADACELPAL